MWFSLKTCLMTLQPLRVETAKAHFIVRADLLIRCFFNVLMIFNPNNNNISDLVKSMNNIRREVN